MRPKQPKKQKEASRYIKNSLWMLSEYSIKIVSAIIVTIYVARYLGPDEFGKLSYAIAITAIFMAISRLGMESILVRDIARSPAKNMAYMGTAFWLMSGAALACITGTNLLSLLLEPNRETQLYIFIMSTGIAFQAFLTIEYNLQGQVKAKYSSSSKSIAMMIGSIIKIYLVEIKASPLIVVISFALDYALIALALIFTHISSSQGSFLLSAQKKLIKPLISSAWPMVLSALASILYMRIDQIMIKNMLSSHELGIYSAATKIYEGWIIIPYALSISLIPAIVRIKSNHPDKYESSMKKLFSILFWSGVIAALIATLFGDLLIKITFGPAFEGAQTVLSISMWTAAFTAIGSVTARYLTIEGMEKKIAQRTIFGLLMNIVLNIFLIPSFGIEGAAIATLITIISINYLINYADRDLAQLTRICNAAITLELLRK